MQMLQEKEKKRKKREGKWTGIWSVVYLTRASICIVAAAQKVNTYQSNKTICFTLLSTIASHTYIHTYNGQIEKVRDASFVMVKIDNSINHIFTCVAKKKLAIEKIFIILFQQKKDIWFTDELQGKRKKANHKLKISRVKAANRE